jgi:hypothetical protein
MRYTLFLLPMLLCAGPALAEAPAAPNASPVPPQLADPALAARLANVAQAMSKAFLDLPVGEVRAAVEGRAATPAEKRITVRDIARKEDPDFDRHVQQQIAQARPMIEQSMKALSDALPAMLQSLEQARNAVERAAANMPDPTYPKR